jgi:hypothetical protein
VPRFEEPSGQLQAGLAERFLVREAFAVTREIAQ